MLTSTMLSRLTMAWRLINILLFRSLLSNLVYYTPQLSRFAIRIGHKSVFLLAHTTGSRDFASRIVSNLLSVIWLVIDTDFFLSWKPFLASFFSGSVFMTNVIAVCTFCSVDVCARPALPRHRGCATGSHSIFVIDSSFLDKLRNVVQ